MTNSKIVLAYLLEILSGLKNYLILMFIVTAIWATDLSLRKYVLKNILDTAIYYHGSKELMHKLLWPSTIYILMSLGITTVFRFYGYFIDVLMVPKLKQRIADKAFGNLINKPYSFYHTNAVGDLTYRLTSLTESVVELLKIFIERLLGYFLALIMAIYVLSLANGTFVLVTVIWVIFFIAASAYFFIRLSKLSNIQAESSAQVTAVISDSLANITSVQLFAKNFYQRLKLFRSYKRKLLAEKMLHYCYFWLWFVYGYSFELMQAISFYLLIQYYQAGVISPGDIALVITINITIVEFLNQLTKVLIDFTNHFGKIANALLLMNTPAVNSDETITTPKLTVSAGQIVFNNVSFYYPGKAVLFRDLSLLIKPKEKIGLVGYSGSGKSSFINLILRLYPLVAGEITIDNQDIAKVNLHSLRNNIAVVSQDILLFHDSIYENIFYGNHNASYEEVIKAAKHAGIHDFINSSPAGYNSIVGEKGINLSGGEKQRIIIARAFLKNAPILFLDEATSQLDSHTEQQIQVSLYKLMQHKTTIVIAHRLSTLLQMDRILVFEQGRIIQDGSHDELVTRPGLYQKLWHSQTNNFLQY